MHYRKTTRDECRSGSRFTRRLQKGRAFVNRTANWLVTLTALLVTLVVGVPDGSADFFHSGDVIRTWNEVAFQTARTKSLSDAKAARLYAMINIAMYDAVNGIESKFTLIDRDHALVPPTGAPPFGHPIAAAAAAAHAVLVGLFLDQAPVYNAQLAADLAGLSPAPKVAAGQSWGVNVGGQVLTARAADGISGVPSDEQQPAGVGAGKFPVAWNSQPRHLAPFAIVDPSVYVSSGPPALTGLDYAASYAEVQLLGNNAIADAAKSATFQFWALAAGTNQPPGAWLQVAAAVSTDLHLADTARMFALLSMTMADTVAPTYQTKWLWQHWRPGTAIRQTSFDDGNPYTVADPTWSPRAGGSINGTSPEHWSGHSSFSTAAARVLAGVFCNDAVSFSLDTDPAGGGARTYSSFSEAATEAGLSRVVGGIHFNLSGNLAGTAAGRAIADEVLANKLLLKFGPTHFGQCPL
jgi:hypothetical protein